MRSSIAPLLAGGPALVTVAAAQPQNQARGRAMPQYQPGWRICAPSAGTRPLNPFNAPSRSTPPSRWPTTRLGRATMPQKNYAEAVAALTQVPRPVPRPGREAVHESAGCAAVSPRSPDRDRRVHPPVSKQARRRPQTQNRCGNCERRRQLQEYLQHGTDVSIETSVPAFVSLALGSAFFRLGRLADAEREYKATIAADPKTGEAHRISPSST